MILFGYINIYLYFILMTFESPLKYVLNSIGAINLIYIIKLSAIIYSFIFIVKNYNKTYILVWLSIFTLSIITGIFTIANISQVIFGIYLALPIIFGFAISSKLTKEKLQTFLIVIAAISSIGVIYDYFYDFPWSGFSYTSVDGSEAEGNRSWNQLGIERPSGFSSISWTSATIIILGFISNLIFVINPLLKFVLSIIFLIGIILTTTKAILLVYLLISFYYFIIRFYIGKILIFTLNILIVVVGMLLPISTLYIKYTATDNIALNLILESFFMRLNNAWPNVFFILEEKGLYLLGRGIGGFGGAPYRYDLEQYMSSTDNIYLYFYGVYGLVGLLFILFIFFKENYKIFINHKQEDHFIYYIYSSIILYGTFVNLVEFGIFGVLFGILIVNSLKKVKKY